MDFVQHMGGQIPFIVPIEQRPTAHEAIRVAFEREDQRALVAIAELDPSLFVEPIPVTNPVCSLPDRNAVYQYQRHRFNNWVSRAAGPDGYPVHRDVVTEILKAGVSANDFTIFECGPLLTYAAWRQTEDLVRLALTHGGTPNAPVWVGRNGVRSAEAGASISLVNLAVSEAVSKAHGVWDRDSSGAADFLRAVEVVHVLIDAAPSAVDGRYLGSDGMACHVSVLTTLALAGHRQSAPLPKAEFERLTQRLIDAGADIDRPGSAYGTPPLVTAACAPNIEMTLLLIDAGAQLAGRTAPDLLLEDVRASLGDQGRARVIECIMRRTVREQSAVAEAGAAMRRARGRHPEL